MQSTAAFPFAPKAFDGSSRKVEAGAAFHWLRQASQLFLARPWLWLGAAGLTLLTSIFCLLLPLPASALPVVPLPMLLAGMLLICREQSEDRRPGFIDLFAGFRSKSSGLAVIGLTTALLLSGGLWCGRILAAGTTGMAGILLAGLVALLLAFPVLLAALFAPALHFFNDMSPMQAMRSSFNASLSNWLGLSVFTVLFLMMFLFTIFSAGLGFFLLIPFTSGALFAAYRDIFPGT